MTISRGTTGGGGITQLGSNNLLMTCVHIGHDSQVGSKCILANAATLAGHVIIEDYATVGAFCPVHQHCIVGKYAFIGGGTIVTQDVLPFSRPLPAAKTKPSVSTEWASSAAAYRRSGCRRCKSLPPAAGRQAQHHPGPGEDQANWKAKTPRSWSASSSAASAG